MAKQVVMTVTKKHLMFITRRLTNVQDVSLLGTAVKNANKIIGIWGIKLIVFNGRYNSAYPFNR